MFAPVPVTTNTLALPATEVLTLPFIVGIFTFEVPLAIPELFTDAQVRTPEPLVCRYCPDEPPVIVMLPIGPRLLNADTVKLAVFILPVTPSEPVTLAPKLVTTNTLATPFELMFTFALAAIVTFELPLISAVPAEIGCQVKPPDPFV